MRDDIIKRLNLKVGSVISYNSSFKGHQLFRRAKIVNLSPLNVEWITATQNGIPLDWEGTIDYDMGVGEWANDWKLDETYNVRKILENYGC